MDDSLINFLQNQSVMTLCYAGDESPPFCFPCFFSFDNRKAFLYFKTSSSSAHSIQMLNKPEIAGSILPDRLNVLMLKGVQFQGTVLPPDHPLIHGASRNYYQKFPMALIIPGDIYAIQLSEIKMTNGAKGPGKKIIWRRKEASLTQDQI